MITLSLNEIRVQRPCKSGWETLLKSKQNTHWNEQFPLSEIIDSNGLDDALWCLRVRPEYSNLWRKYAVWCARQVQHLMTDKRSIDALDVAERHARGLAAEAELAAAWAAALAAALAARAAACAAARAAAELDAAWGAARGAAWAAALAARATGDAKWGAWASWAAARAARAAQAQKLREILTRGEW